MASILSKLFNKQKNVKEVAEDSIEVIQTSKIDTEDVKVKVKATTNFTLANEYKKVKMGETIELSQSRANELEKVGLVKKI